MMAGHLLHSGGEGGIGEERHKLWSETCVSYWTRLADSLISTGIQRWHKEWRQYEDNRIIRHRAEFESAFLWADHASVWAVALGSHNSKHVSVSSIACHVLLASARTSWPVLHTNTMAICRSQIHILLLNIIHMLIFSSYLLLFFLLYLTQVYSQKVQSHFICVCYLKIHTCPFEAILQYLIFNKHFQVFACIQ